MTNPTGLVHREQHKLHISLLKYRLHIPQFYGSHCFKKNVSFFRQVFYFLEVRGLMNLFNLVNYLVYDVTQKLCDIMLMRLVGLYIL